MKKEITISKITSLNKIMYRCGIEVQDFEKNFINSLIKNAKYFAKGVKIYGSVTDICNANIKLHISEKQLSIFERIKTRYKNAYENRDAYHIYAQIIEDYDIILEKFDRETLESFKGEKETEESKEWIRQIKFYN